MKLDGRLQTLRMASTIMALADRAGPCGFRSSLNIERGGRELPDQKVSYAAAMHEIVRLIEPHAARRAVVYAMQCDHRGNVQFSRSDIAKCMMVSERTVSRLVSQGLAALDAIGATFEMDRPPKNTSCAVARTPAAHSHI